MGDLSTVRSLVDLRDRTLQKARIAFGNREGALERGVDTQTQATANGSEGSAALFEKWEAHFDALETECERDIKVAIKGIQIIEDLTALKGIGALLAAKMVSMIDITRSDTVSALWRYAGYGVIDGARERPVKGEKLHYNMRLKTTLYLVSGSFLKSGSPYRAIYDDARAYYAANRPEWTAGHCHLASMRRMTKMFLSHFWEHWRKMEGLPVRDPYVLERLGHTHVRYPEEFGWPPVRIAEGVTLSRDIDVAQ